LAARSAAIALLTTQAAEEVAMAEAEEAQRAAAEERHKREIQRRMHLLRQSLQLPAHLR